MTQSGAPAKPERAPEIGEPDEERAAARRSAC
jgi:hypothetical protein